MVRKLTDDGKGYYHEPPYTEEEEMDIYRRLDAGPVRILHGPPLARLERSRPAAEPQPTSNLLQRPQGE